jgi:hypothetical protein
MLRGNMPYLKTKFKGGSLLVRLFKAKYCRLVVVGWKNNPI